MFKKIRERLRSVFGTSGLVIMKEQPDARVDTSSPWSTSTSIVRQMFLFWIVGAIVVFVSYLIFKSLSLVYLILTAALVAVAMEVFIRWWERWMWRGLSIGIMYVILVVFILLGALVIIPFVLNQSAILLDMFVRWVSGISKEISTLGVPGYVDSITWLPPLIKDQIVSDMSLSAPQWQHSITTNISSLVSYLSLYASNISATIFSIIGSTLKTVWQVVLVLIMAVFFSVENRHVKNFFVKHSSSDLYQDSFMTQRVEVFYRKMGTWIKTQLILSVFIFVIVYVALGIAWWFWLRLPNIFSLALMAWLVEFIPYIGPVVGAIPAILVATMMFGWKWFIVVSLIFVVIQQLESNVLVPILMKKSLGVSPLLILLSALFFGSAIWFVGVLMAVPFAILITMLVKKDFE